jgi:RNA exonuclease NGL2
MPFMILADDYLSDYIFYMPSPRRSGPQVKGILLPHGAKALEPGLPRKNVCASDHVLLGVDMEI